MIWSQLVWIFNCSVYVKSSIKCVLVHNFIQISPNVNQAYVQITKFNLQLHSLYTEQTEITNNWSKNLKETKEIRRRNKEIYFTFD